ncbi:MAG TPA: caspase family protein [Pedobacter sp.]|uniref:caspase family protein n=1 Tax=Pedobacter sp. TaxID=1411316 RepID=UPI002BF2BD73|nr:caspase family protein [Pedobacter sp.]HMI01222.1 caspase family protein [Pedobacter sp.]
MRLYQLVFILLLIWLQSGNLEAQAQIAGKTEKDANALIKQSEKLRREEKELQADKLLLEANEIYPVAAHLNEVALNKAKTGDINGANKIWSALFSSLKEYAVDHKSYNRLDIKSNFAIYYGAQITNNATYGSPKVVVQVSKDYLEQIDGRSTAYIDGIIYSAAEYAFLMGDFESVRYFNDAAKRLNSKLGLFITNVYILLADQKYDEALAILKDAAANGANFNSSKHFAAMTMITVYELKKDYGNMETFLQQNPSVDKNILSYYNGLVALHKRDYDTALRLFNEGLKPFRVGWTTVEQTNKYKYFTNRAKAYAGLKDYINARKDYEAALTFSPDYKPAIEGLGKLESTVITEMRTDKTPPVILITEPSNTRGLKITRTGDDIMIKGRATDASGIKMVRFNDTLVYAKENGEFWGAVRLKTGLNKIRIQAADMSGNQAEEVIEIDRSVSQAVPLPIAAVTEKQGKNYALLIASQNYDDEQIPSLENPIADAIKLKLILKSSYNFTDENVFQLFNPKREDFKKKFLELKEVIQPEDNLVIFYAGHGIWVEKEKKGYWLLTDAQRNDVNTWLPNKEMLNLITEITARHTLLITDACFSGSVFKTRGLKDAPPVIREMDNKISRVAITSGNDTEVPDESVFMKYLVKALSQNKEQYLTAQKMFITQILEAVMAESKTEPRYGTLELAGHIGGDFIFTKK